MDREGILPQAPLFYVLASVRFQPWMLLPSKIPEIQDALRDRLPLFNQIGFAPGQLPLAPAPAGTWNAWAFHSADRSVGCQMAQDQIVVHATTYSRFKEFAESVLFVLQVVEKYARQFDVGAIGIRYLDKISPRKGETLADYLPPQYLPQPVPGTDFQPTGGAFQTAYRTQTGVLQARFWTGQEYVAVPDDLIQLFVLTREIRPGGPVLPTLQPGHGILDSDSIWTSNSPTRMTGAQVVQRLEELHTHSNTFFRKVCSDHAFKVWTEVA